MSNDRIYLIDGNDIEWRASIEKFIKMSATKSPDFVARTIIEPLDIFSETLDKYHISRSDIVIVNLNAIDDEILNLLAFIKEINDSFAIEKRIFVVGVGDVAVAQKYAKLIDHFDSTCVDAADFVSVYLLL